MFESIDYHVPTIAKLICKCGKEMYFDIPSGVYRHVGEKGGESRGKTWTNEYVPGEKPTKVTYSENDPNASWNNPK